MACLYPYVGELIHYDATDRKKRGKMVPSIERYKYRGAGGLAHKILRTDPDAKRLGRTREGLQRLVEDSGTALGKLASALSRLDRAPPKVMEDELEPRCEIVRETLWVELLREGVARIVSRKGQPQAKQVEALMRWVPLSIAMHTLALASFRGDKPVDECPPLPPIPVDCQQGANAVRGMARSSLMNAIGTIFDAMGRAAKEKHPELLKGPQKWREAPRTFFTSTLHAVGAVNAPAGLRHFCLRAELLEAIVMALVEDEMSFERFCREILFDRLRLVVDGDSARRADLLVEVDRRHFDANASALATLFTELGLLRAYSDATRMVGLP